MDELTLYTIIGVGVYIIGIIIYILPLVIACERKHSDRGLIILVNLLLGWTIIGWIICLVWALLNTDKSKTISSTTDKVASKTNKYESLEKLMKLKQDGVLTETEFEIEKQKILR